MRPYFIIIKLYLIFFSCNFATAQEPLISRNSTQISDIDRWEDLPGGQYVLGYSSKANGELELAAVYDKTLIGSENKEFGLVVFLQLVLMILI